ncbi:MAG: cellulase family glycosylhydrolase, partial [Stenotrophobium sp.]
FGDNDLQWLADNGFNGLRLGIEDYGVEPQPGIYDDTYIGQIAATAKLAAAHGVYPLIDFHQDDYSPAFNGNGFPAWMVQDDGLPHQPDVGFPYSQFTMPAMLVAWDHFWANSVASDGTGLQDHFAAAVAHVATQLAGIDGLLGYEYLNEPWPGTQYPTCVVPLVGCPIFDATLTAFNRKVAPKLRAVDSRHLIFAEPNVLFNDGIQTNIGALNVSNAGFAFHVYCLLAGADASSESPGGAQLCPTMEELAFSNADAHVAKTGEALMMTEFGATPDTEVVSRNTASADKHMVSWLWWTYNEGTGLNPAADPPDQKLIQPVADLLVRAYPQIVAGTPTSWSFDPAKHVFDLHYSTARAGGGTLPADAETVVYLPTRHYPHGYTVTVTGATVISQPGATKLELLNQAGVQSVTLHVEPL